MRLVIDCFKLVKGQGKSLGIYNLTKSLVKHLGENNSGNREIVVLGNKYNRQDFSGKGVRFLEMKGNPLNKKFDVWWELVYVNRILGILKADRVLFPRGFRPLKCVVPDTVIVHDLIPFYYNERFPGYLNKVENAYIMERLKKSILKADSVITVSEYTKRDILRRFSGAKARQDSIYVIQNGVNDMEPEVVEAARAERKTAKAYISAITSPLPHKNATGILKAYEHYYRNTENPLPLMIVGIDETEEYYPEMDPEAAQHVGCISYMKQYDHVCKFIGASRVFLFLSTAEGFGFPPVEAMQLGVPVVCSDAWSLPEICKDAAVMVDPGDPEAVSDALNSVLEDEHKASDLINRGSANVLRFSWKSRTELYQKVLFK
ncbi:MAG: glycosyltransferase family 4 protein [Lachnospiraceae bacterium]|nr:glycosyltransferase family 4 protein [Lachnospiraceae bacterium]